MTISTLSDYIGAAKQRVPMIKTATRTTVAAGWFSLLDLAGEPGAGTLAGSSTAAGVVPTQATNGYPKLNPFDLGAPGYVSTVEFSSSVACRIALFDEVFRAGAYAFNASTALSGQPSFASRLPNTDYKGLEIWVEQVTAATGNQAVNVTYTDQDGNVGNTTGAVGIGSAPTVGRCWLLPYAAGDSGVRAITNVAGTVATAGTFNVMVLRRLWTGRVRSANDGDIHDMLRVGLIPIFETSALRVLVAADGTSSGISDLAVTVANY